jgi:hypothetical protein
LRFLLLLVFALLVAPSLPAAQSSASPAIPAAAQPAPAAAQAPAPAPEAERAPQFGLALTLGAPDGAVLSFTWSPLWWLMVDAGFAYTLAPGIVIGLEFRPIDYFITPILRGEYGYYFTGNTTSQIKKWAGLSPEQAALVGDASYDWWSGLVGFALGSRRGFTVALEGGVGWLSLNVKGGSSTVNGVQVTTADYKVQSFMPVARLSFLYFF